MKEEKSVSDVICLVMNQNGIEKIRHASYVSQVLGISKAQAHRKVNGSSWEVEQILKVIKSLNFPARSFFALLCEGVSEVYDGIYENSLPCKIYVSTSLTGNNDFAAIKVNDKWYAYNKDNAPEQFKSENTCEVVFIELLSSHASISISPLRPRIAILDDDFNILESMKELLNETYDVNIFSNIESLSDSIGTELYDGYILDWIINGETSRRLIDAIRKSLTPNAPIFIVTGQGVEVDEGISDAIDEHDIIGPYQKPVRIDFLKSQLKRSIGR